nr:MAG TPA: hypothetical protein [Caudoviricetes sp.]
MNTEYRNKISNFIQNNKNGMAALLYIADFEMPTQKAIDSRRAEIAFYVLRSIGYETLTEQSNDREKNGYYLSLKQMFNTCTKIVNGHKPETKKEALTPEEAQAWLNQHNEEVRIGDEWRKQYKQKIDIVLKNFTVMTISSHEQFQQAAQIAKTESSIHLEEMLATSGSILVYGTPATRNGKDFWVTDAQRALVRELQNIWGIY